MKVLVFKSEHDVDNYVGKYLTKHIQEHQTSTIGFATGSTPLGIYNYLIDSYQKGEVDFSNVVAFNLDEYAGIEKDHPRSFATAMKNHLFSKINIKDSNIHALDGNVKDLEAECQRYEQEITLNPIDIQILGIGMDGHIAYNEPGTSFDSKCHVVDLHQESIVSSLNYGFKCVEDVPKQGVSQGIKTIMKAKELVMIAKGEKKAKLVERMLNGPVCEAFPSSIIQCHDNVIVVLDEQAAKYLQEEDYERY